MENKGVHMEWVGHLGKAFDSFVRDLRKVLPEETYNHLRGSRKELLLAVRSIIDREIQRTEKESQPEARKVEVQ